MKPSALALFLAAVLAVLPAGASGAPVDTTLESQLVTVSAPLLVNYFGGTGGRDTWIAVGSEEAVAKVTLTAPAGYTPKLDHAPGTDLGSMNALLYSVGGSPVTGLGGRVVADNPARYVSDPAAQACAPGSHAAVWRVRLTDNTQTFELPIFVDRAGAAAGSGATLRWCPVWPSPSGVGFTARSLDFTVEGVFGKLEASGQNSWSALMSPPLPSLAADESRTFEARAHEPVPHEVKLRPRYDARKHMVDLAGTVTAAGRPEAGASLHFHVLREWDEDVSVVGPVVTNAAGRFSFKARIAESEQYIASTVIKPRRCSAPSSAPKGCVLETVAAPPHTVAVVRARRPTDARLALRARDQARARRINLSLGDLRKGWRDGSMFTGHRCPASAYDARVSRLTATGYFETDRLVRGTGAVSSRTTVFVSGDQARTALAREASALAARCLGDAYTQASPYAPRVFVLKLPALGQERHGFRVLARNADGRRKIDLISFRQGRVVVHLAFESMSAKAARTLAAKVAARARR
jgi:hypothetical protein